MDRTALVEPKVPKYSLVDERLRYSVIPSAVRDRFPGITVGGGYAGTSEESGLLKHEFHNCTISNVEIVLENRKVIDCSDSENADSLLQVAGVVGILSLDSDRIELQFRRRSTTKSRITRSAVQLRPLKRSDK